MKWRQFVLSLVVYEVFVLGTQWLFLDGIFTIATIVFTAFSSGHEAMAVEPPGALGVDHLTNVWNCRR